MSSERLCFLNCETSDKSAIYRFPSENGDSERRKTWFSHIGLPEFTSGNNIIYLCSKHFSKRQYNGINLARNAVPDINLPKDNYVFTDTENQQKQKLPVKSLSINTPIETVEQSSTDSDDTDDTDDIDDVDDIRTIRVDKVLYDKIMNSDMLYNEALKRTTMSKNVQTGMDKHFPCAMVEYNFERKVYFLKCFFCSDTFYLYEWDLFEMHMLYQHDSFRNHHFRTHAKTERILTDMKKKFLNTDTVTPCEPVLIVANLDRNSTSINGQTSHQITTVPEITPEDPLDIQSCDFNTEDSLVSELNKSLNDQEETLKTNIIFKKIVLKNVCNDNEMATGTSTIKEIDESSSRIDEGIDDANNLFKTVSSNTSDKIKEPFKILPCTEAISNNVEPVSLTHMEKPLKILSNPATIPNNTSAVTKISPLKISNEVSSDSIEPVCLPKIKKPFKILSGPGTILNNTISVTKISQLKQNNSVNSDNIEPVSLTNLKKPFKIITNPGTILSNTSSISKISQLKTINKVVEPVCLSNIKKPAEILSNPATNPNNTSAVTKISPLKINNNVSSDSIEPVCLPKIKKPFKILSAPGTILNNTISVTKISQLKQNKNVNNDKIEPVSLTNMEKPLKILSNPGTNPNNPSAVTKISPLKTNNKVSSENIVPLSLPYNQVIKNCRVLLKRIDLKKIVSEQKQTLPIVEPTFNSEITELNKIVEDMSECNFLKESGVEENHQITKNAVQAANDVQVDTATAVINHVVNNECLTVTENTVCSDFQQYNDNAETGFDTVEMLVEEENACPTQKENTENSEDMTIICKENIPKDLESVTDDPYKPYAVFSNETNNMIMLSNKKQNGSMFYRNLKISSNDDTLCCSDVYSTEDDEENESLVDKEAITDNEIRFRTTTPSIVDHFIELLRTNTVLWFDRNRAVEKYDIAVSNIIMELSMAYKLSMTILEVRRSINRIKAWFQRMVNKMNSFSNKNNFALPYPIKYDLYFKKCFEFLPRNENYSKWYTTQGTETAFRAKHLSVVTVYECEFCKMLFERKHLYVLHMNMMHKKCKQCFKACADDKTLAKHLKQHQTTKAKPNYECEVCQKGFYLKNMLRAHMTTHGGKKHPNAVMKDGKKMFLCRVCGKEFGMPYLRKWHELKHDAPQFKCEFCNKSYYTKFNLEQHKKSHKNQRDYMCDICGKAYFTRKNLLGHQDVVHFRRNSIVCDICGLDVSNPTNLERHKRSAHIERREEGFIEYVCKRNGQSFICKRKKQRKRRDGSTYSHERKGWRCKICGIVFPKFKQLLTHKTEEHSVNKMVPCPLCNKRMGEIYIKRHIKQVHKDAKLEEIELETLEATSNILDDNNGVVYDYNTETTQTDEFQYIEKNNEKENNDEYNNFIVVDEVDEQDVGSFL